MIATDLARVNTEVKHRAEKERQTSRDIKERCFFVLSRAWDKEKILSPHEESNLRPSELRSDALPLSHRDSSVKASTTSLSLRVICLPR